MEKQEKEKLQQVREKEAHDPNYQDISYRDRISTIEMDGKRHYIHPKIPKGSFTKWRNIVGVFLLFLLFAFPLIKINGDPLLMLNFIERKFIIFGVIFWPQDTFILLLLTLSFILFIILFTVTYGRIFCGWLCPQTIFLEIIFRRIEYWFEGNPTKQKKLNNGPWNAKKLSIKLSKWIVFYTISLILVNVILWYFMSFDKWLLYAQNIEAHYTGLGLIIIFTSVFFGIYTWFREQICLIACPYGRMQGVLIDPSTILISYDYLRGEPRGVKKKGDTANSYGDCINCHACIDVCPTGIDIRNGTQLECVNCTACIDACNDIMHKTKKPKGLIRYASEREISTGIKQKFTTRSIAYSVVLMGILAFFFTMLFTRTEVETVVLRTPGILYQEAGPDSLSNIYNIKVVNKTRKRGSIDVQLSDVPGQVIIVGGTLLVAPEAKTESVLFIKIAKKDIPTNKFKLQLDILHNGKIIDHSKVTFISPNK